MPNDVVVIPVTTRRQRKQFLQLPWTLYRNDPHWIPPLRQSQKELVGYKHHPFYDDAEVQTFLALQSGTPCGRIAAIENFAHNRKFKERRGFFGFFESIDDQQVANGLFDAVLDWLKQRDIHAVRGPVNPSMNYECGLLIDGFDSPPTFMMTYNPPYYERLIEACGFRKAEDMYAYLGHLDMLDSLDKKLDFVIAEATRRFDLKLRKLDKPRLTEELRMFLDIYNKAMAGLWNLVPLSDGEIQHIGAGLRHLIVPELVTIAEVDGKPIGAVFALLDYNPLIRKIDGRLFPFGFIRLMLGRRKLKRVRMMSTNVLPEYQRWGVGLVLLDPLVPALLDWGIGEVEFSWVLESNYLSSKTLERGGAVRSKTYRLYDYGPGECNMINEG